MGPMIQSGSDLFGITATLIGFALLIIWGLFMIFGIRINRRGIRFAGTILLAVTLSMMLGLMYSKGPVESIHPGGLLGNWISMNCKLIGMDGLALFLAFLATAASLMLATDWLFIDYLMDAIGIQNQVAYAGASPMGRARNGPEPLLPPPSAAMPRPMSRPPDPSQHADRPEGGATAGIVGRADPGRIPDAPEIRIRDERAAPWWSGGHGTALVDEPVEAVGPDRTAAPTEETSPPLIEEEIFARDAGEETLGLRKAQGAISPEGGEGKPIEETSVEYESVEKDPELNEPFEEDAEEDEGYGEVETDEDASVEDEECEEAEADVDASVEDEECEEAEADIDASEEDEMYPEEVVLENPSLQRVYSIHEVKEETLKEDARSVEEGEIAVPMMQEEDTVSVDAAEFSAVEPLSDSPSVDSETSEGVDRESAFEAAGLVVTEDDDPFRRALALLMEEQEASIALLQKHLGLGYFKAAKLIDQLEKKGVLSPPREGKTRAVLLAPEELERMTGEGEQDDPLHPKGH